MIHLINETCRGPMLRIILPTILISMALVGSISEPAAAAPGASEEIRLAVTDQELQDAGSLTRIRRRIAIAARAVCDPEGVDSLFSHGARLCREQARADAERQIEDRIAELRDSGRPGAVAVPGPSAALERINASPPGSLLSPGRSLADGQGQPAVPVALAAALGLLGLSFTMAHATR
jgi:UrcA family protein